SIAFSAALRNRFAAATLSRPMKTKCSSRSLRALALFVTLAGIRLFLSQARQAFVLDVLPILRRQGRCRSAVQAFQHQLFDPFAVLLEVGILNEQPNVLSGRIVALGSSFRIDKGFQMSRQGQVYGCHAVSPLGFQANSAPVGRQSTSTLAK